MSYWLSNSTFWKSILIWLKSFCQFSVSKSENAPIFSLLPKDNQTLLKTVSPLLLRTEVWINLELFFKYQSCLKSLYLGALQCLQDHSILEIAGHLPGCGAMFMFYHGGVQQLHKCLSMQLWKQSKNNKIKIIVNISNFLHEELFTL